MTQQKLSLEEQEKQRQDEVNAMRSLYIYNALEMLNKGQHRITDFFYQKNCGNLQRNLKRFRKIY